MITTRTGLLALSLLSSTAFAQGPSRQQMMSARTTPPAPTSFTWTARQTEQGELMMRTLGSAPAGTVDIVMDNIQRMSTSRNVDASDRESAYSTLTWIAVNGTGRARTEAIRRVAMNPEGARILSTMATADRFMTPQQRQEVFDAIELGIALSLPPRLAARPQAPAAVIVIPPLPQGVEFVGGRLQANGAIGRANLDALVAQGRFDVGGNLNANGLRLGIEATGRLVLVGVEGRTTPIDVLGMTVAANGNAAILVRGRGTAGIFANAQDGIRAGVGGELFIGARAEAGASITIPLLIVDITINPRGNVRFGAGVSGEAQISLRDENGWKVGARLAGSAALGPGGGLDLGVWLTPGSAFRNTSPAAPIIPADNTLMGPPRTQPAPVYQPLRPSPSIHAPGMGPRSDAGTVLPFLAAMNGGSTPSGSEVGRYDPTTGGQAVAADSGTGGAAIGAGMLRL